MMYVGKSHRYINGQVVCSFPEIEKNFILPNLFVYEDTEVSIADNIIVLEDDEDEPGLYEINVLTDTASLLILIQETEVLDAIVFDRVFH